MKKGTQIVRTHNITAHKTNGSEFMCSWMVISFCRL